MAQVLCFFLLYFVFISTDSEITFIWYQNCPDIVKSKMNRVEWSKKVEKSKVKWWHMEDWRKKSN